MPGDPPPRVPPEALRLGMLFGGGAVVGLWAVQANASADADVLLATAAHLAGLLAGYGILVLLLLMARVPAVEHGVGADRLARWHARGGRFVVGGVAAHALLAWGAYLAHTGRGPLGGAADLLGYPALAAATAGTVLLLAAGAVSARAVRARVSHETWRGVHLLTYAGAAAAFFHQPAGPDLAGIPVLAWLWSLLHAQVAVLLLWYRAAVPLRAALRHRIRVVDVRSESPDTVSVVMRGRALAALQAEPGQFFRWRFLTRRLWRTALPFSLSAPPVGDTLRITVKVVGGHTRRVKRLRPGVRVAAAGPFGAMTARVRTRRKVLLIAGGAGITPLRALFETLPGGPGDLTLLYRARTSDQLLLHAELEQIAAGRQCRLHYLLGSSRGPDDPLTAANLRRLVPDIAEHDVYLCGSPGMADAASRALRRAGVPPDRVHAEVFAF
ncbi:ferredoxin reductase family protein [Yinghuangia soli]|uniref:Ferric reductase-like transmembrane domain-containing protein n=1 Tax=Yinghuangia soli TaxID=2908204 RepID=A0AA41Q1X3_9ACTN|nr:ferredoxin reductase family protein [Yinghuangia soli]MCF2530044.1 ferric reductase-like transmembrane domain-containing protein [Yinghuangia soli]